jgi:hypothetical protein
VSEASRRRRDSRIPFWDEGWGWWVKVVLVSVATVGAAGLITFGAYRYLTLAAHQSDRVECLQVQTRLQAEGTALMARVVLDPRIQVEQRRQAVADWSDEQGRIAERIGRC